MLDEFARDRFCLHFEVRSERVAVPTALFCSGRSLTDSCSLFARKSCSQSSFCLPSFAQVAAVELG